MPRKLLLIATATALLPACEVSQNPANAPAETNASATVDPAADEQTIRSTNEHWLRLIGNKDAAGVAQLYAEDGMVMPANEKAAGGRKAIREWWNRWMQVPGYDLTFQTDQLVLSRSRDMALDRGTYRFAATLPSGAINDTGKYVVVWRKIGDEWKVAADIFNSDLPAAGG